MATTTGSGRAGRPRRGEVDTLAKRAVLEVVEDHGYSAASFDEVVARTGFAKTTLYRRWPNVRELILDALTDFQWLSRAVTADGRPDSDQDFQALVDLLEQPGVAGAYAGLYADSIQDAELRQRLHATVRAASMERLQDDYEVDTVTAMLIMAAAVGAALQYKGMTGGSVPPTDLRRLGAALGGLSGFKPSH